MDSLLIIAAFVILMKSADEAVKRMTHVAAVLSVSDFAVSFLVAGIVSVLPELSIGVNSAIEGIPSFGLGIIFGSNIADLLLVVGIFALSLNNVKLSHIENMKNWKLIAVLALPVILLFDGKIAGADTIILLFAFLAYAKSLLGSKLKNHLNGKKKISIAREIFVAVILLIIMLLAGKVITDSSYNIALKFGVPIFFIGTLIAAGTCLPELAFAVRASKIKRPELGLGNIMGNVITDCLLSLGIISAIRPIVPEQPMLAIFTGLLMVFAGVIIISVILNRRIGKKEGILLIGLYFVFIFLQAFIEPFLLAVIS